LIENETDEQEIDVPDVLALLDPTVINTDYASGFDLEIKGDIDSFVICCQIRWNPSSANTRAILTSNQIYQNW